MQGIGQVLTQKGWSDSRYEGIALRRIFKRLAKKAEVADNGNDLESLINIAKTLGYIAQAKATLAKLERELALEKRIEELERLAGLAQKAVIRQ